MIFISLDTTAYRPQYDLCGSAQGGFTPTEMGDIVGITNYTGMIIGTNSIFDTVGVTTKTAIFSMDTLICSHYFKILTSYVYIYIYLSI